MANLDTESEKMTEGVFSFDAMKKAVKEMYQPPRLVRYGEIAEMTMKTGSASDAPLEGGFSA